MSNNKLEALEQRVSALEADRDDCNCVSHVRHRNALASGASQERIADAHRAEREQEGQRWASIPIEPHVVVRAAPGAPLPLLITTQPPRLPRNDDGTPGRLPDGFSLARDGGRAIMPSREWDERLAVDPQCLDWFECGWLVADELPESEARVHVRRQVSLGRAKLPAAMVVETE